MTYSLPKVISTSQITTYRHCPRQYFLRYVMKIEPDVKSPALELGSRVHAKIALLDFKSNDPIEALMLSRAENILESSPPNPILETTYEDPNNPGRFFGDVLGNRAIGIFDFHWADRPFAGDWKTGNFYSQYTESYEIQGYILNELYKQHYDKPLENMYFEFLKPGKLYCAKSVTEQDSKHSTEETIKSVLEDINWCKFDRNKTFLCKWCDLSKYCKKDYGLDSWL